MLLSALVSARLHASNAASSVRSKQTEPEDAGGKTELDDTDDEEAFAFHYFPRKKITWELLCQ